MANQPNWNDAVRDAKEAEIEKFIQAASDRSGTGGKHVMSEQEKEDMRDFMREGGQDRWKAKAKLDVDNRRTAQQIDNSESAQAKANGLTEHEGLYYDKWGRECDHKGYRV